MMLCSTVHREDVRVENPASDDDEGEINVKQDKAFVRTPWLERVVFDAFEKEFSRPTTRFSI